MNDRKKNSASVKRFYTAKEVADIIFEDLPFPDEASDIDFSSDSENEDSLTENRNVDHVVAEEGNDDVEVIEEDESSVYLSSSTESEESDTDSSADEENTNNSTMNNSDAQPIDDLQVQEDLQYDVEQNRKWKKVQKAKFQPTFNQPQGKLSV